MELTQNGEITTRKVRVSVEDGIIVPSVHGRDMKVADLLLVYTVEEGQWVLEDATVWGLRLKLDRTVGRKTDDVKYWSSSGYPDWVAKAAEHYRPKEPAPAPAIPTCVLDVEET